MIGSRNEEQPGGFGAQRSGYAVQRRYQAPIHQVTLQGYVYT